MSFAASNARVERKAVWGRAIRLTCAVTAIALAGGCGDLARQGTGSSYLIVNALEAASGATPDEFGGNLLSDVLTIVDNVPTIFNDLARVRFSLGLKDPGGSELPTTPTTANFITINRYRVNFVRSDGRNTPGVDVPYGFDGAFTGTVGASEIEAGFEIVRHTAKREAPLAALAANRVIISTIAEVIFYGRDQTGREVTATARMLVDFGNFADPDSDSGS
jgi:hypothetical protein